MIRLTGRWGGKGDFVMVWARFATARLCGVLLALPLGAAGLYATWQATLSANATCRALRTSVLSALEQNVDEKVKRALVHKDLTEFERSCALTDPEAKAVFSAFDRSILFTGDPEGGRARESRPVRFVPRPPGFERRWPGHLPPPPPPEEFRRRPFGT